MELYEKTAVQLHEMLKAKECTAEEIAKNTFHRIQAAEPKVNAYVTLCEEQALEQAKQVDRLIAAGEELPLLAGIPVGIKDNICTKDVLTTCGSKMLSNFAPPYQATVMDKLSAQQIVMTGKLNMDEFAMGSSTETSYFGPTKNPRDLTRVPGGSSGGSAAAVAAGECALALGSDTGGSIRQPASFCGVVGLKPTYGAVSRFGLVAFASSLDQIGPLGRTVEDVALLYSAICGADKMDATSVSSDGAQVYRNLKASGKGLRIGIPKEYFGEGITSEVRESVMNAAKEMEKQGATLVEISLPSTKYALNAYYIIASAEASSNLARFDGVKYGYRTPEYENLTDMYEKTRSEGFGDEVKRRIMLGTFVLSSGYYDAYYKRARLLQQQISAEFAEGFGQCDVMLTPTVPAPAFGLGEKLNDPVQMYAGDLCTVTVNIAGLPGISVPCGMGANGMPMGMQMIGPKFSEQTLLNTAKWYEEICGGFGGVAAL